MTTGQSAQSGQHPLQSDRGTTTIASNVVSSIVSVAAGEVDGLVMPHGGNRLPGDNSPTVSEFLDRVSGSGSRSCGISVEIGEREAAGDLTVNVIYGKPIIQVTEAVRHNVIRRVESLAGLDVNEVNVTVNDVTFLIQ